MTYHDSCHLCHGQKVVKEPREILKGLPSVNYIECRESTWCCGSAGIYNITQPVSAKNLQDRKIANVLRTKCDIVTTANPGCHIQLVNGLNQKGGDAKSIEVLHPIEMLAQAYKNEK